MAFILHRARFATVLATAVLLALAACDAVPEPASEAGVVQTDALPAEGDEAEASPPAGTVASAEAVLPEDTESAAAAAAGATAPDPAQPITIGVEDGRDEEIFGRIQDIAVRGPDLFILDGQALTVRWFDARGAYRGVAGRSGGGPGEFRAPAAAEVDELGRLHVLDTAHRRISVFETGADGLSLVDEIQIPVHGMDFCWVDGRLFVLAPTDDALLHELTAEGDLVASFGESAVTIDPSLEQHAGIIRELQNRGRLVCAPAAGTLAVVREQVANVTAFTADRAVLWDRRLTGFRQRGFMTVRNGAGVQVTPDPESGTAHTVKNAVLVSDSLIAVSLKENGPENVTGEGSVRILRLRDGAEVSAEPAQAVLAGVTAGRVYWLYESPFPRLEVVPNALKW